MDNLDGAASDQFHGAASDQLLGIDIGGTFTDLVLWEPLRGRFWVEKTLTTPDDPALGVLRGLAQLLEQDHVRSSSVTRTVHATTLAANAVVERRGARTALMTTLGFGDALELRRENRYDLYDLFLRFPRPLVSRSAVIEVRERVDARGNVIVALEGDVLEEAIRALRELDVESVGICYLHSYANPEHERQTAAAVSRALPQLAISVSHRVAPEIGEYERASTVTVDAYVKPLLNAYLKRLVEGVRRRCQRTAFFLMASHGGLVTVDEARERPVRLIESGPTAGVLAATHHGSSAGLDRVLAFDMGGTTAKGCLVIGGQAATVIGFEVAREDRYQKGSGLPLQIPAIELLEIGAGGGSVARVDSAGFLNVGPESAGSKPGPVCYGLGGSEPTVTDADLTLGYLREDSFLGGRMRLDARAAHVAIDAHVAKPMGITTSQAAWGIHELINERMAGAFRLYVAEMGEDPRDFTLVATGGAGPVHALGVARKLGIRQILFPPRAGVASAFGLLVSPPKSDGARPYVSRLQDIDLGHVIDSYQDMEGECVGMLRTTGATDGEIDVQRLVDMRYIGQGHQIPIALPEWPLSEGGVSRLRENFRRAYAALHGQSLDADVESVTWRLVASVKPIQRETSQFAEPRTVRGQSTRTCMIWSGEVGDYVAAARYARSELETGTEVLGPAIIEEAASTIVLGSHTRARIDRHSNLIAEIGGETG